MEDDPAISPHWVPRSYYDAMKRNFDTQLAESERRREVLRFALMEARGVISKALLNEPPKL